jgi:hypothetical protein
VWDSTLCNALKIIDIYLMREYLFRCKNTKKTGYMYGGYGKRGFWQDAIPMVVQ